MRLQRPLKTTTGRIIASISKAMVIVTILEQLLVLIPDGGNFSEIKMDMSLMKEERLLPFKEV